MFSYLFMCLGSFAFMLDHGFAAMLVEIYVMISFKKERKERKSFQMKRKPRLHLGLCMRVCVCYVCVCVCVCVW